MVTAYLSIWLALLSPVSEASIRGAGISSMRNNEQILFPSSRFLLTNERRLLDHEGVMRTLIIRVTDAAGNSPITDARMQSDTWFGTHDLMMSQNQNSMSGLYDQCSGGKLIFIPASGQGVVDGVLEITVKEDLAGLSVSDAGGVVRGEFNELNKDLGIEFEAFSMILPIGVSGSSGLARQGGSHQMYAGGAERSLELVMHEFGHNLGLHHSGIPNEGDYDDNSCLMGCCAGAQQMCFNAAKSWFSGWYSDEGRQGYHEVSFESPGQWWKGSLVGIDDYLNNLFDEHQHRVVVKMNSLFMMFNRKKGVNSGVKAYGDEVVVVQQWGESGRSTVLAHMNLDEDEKVFAFSKDILFTDFDIIVEICGITFPQVTTGPKISGGTASQSSTGADADAGRAIDGNLDQTWAGGSITHTSGDDEDINPWWKWTLEEQEEIGHVRIFNRIDCCGNRLNNAILELTSEDGEVVFKRSLGHAKDVKEVFLGNAYPAKEVKISLLGDKILSLAEVQVFAPTSKKRLPDSAEVVAYASDGSQSVTCETTFAPTKSISPSTIPTKSLQPTIYKAVPIEVVLMRDSSPCIFQSNPNSHPDRFKRTLEPTAESAIPGGYGNKYVSLTGKDGCIIIVQPVTWAWEGNSFIFQSLETLDSINSCFHSNTLITESLSTDTPSFAPSVPTVPHGVVLLREEGPCIFQSNPSNHPDRFKCMIKPTTPNSDPGNYDNDEVWLKGNSRCIISVQPVTWAWEGNAFIFQSSYTLDAINDCFAPGTLLIVAHSGPTPTPSLAPSISVIPPDVMLQRDDTPCIFQSNPTSHPDRFKCAIEPTTLNGEPGSYGNDSVWLKGNGGCVIAVQPVTWAWDGKAFIFQSSESLATINECFGVGTLIEGISQFEMASIFD